MSRRPAFSQALRAAVAAGRAPIVADIKPVSPKHGDLLGGRDPVLLARQLVEAGACALSVVTEPTRFGGSLDLLRRVAAAVGVPVLRKDFLATPEQVRESADAGAAAVLIILATTPPGAELALHEAAVACGIEAVVEAHTREELARAAALAPAVIGINNRDIRGLERDAGGVEVTEALAPLAPRGSVVLSESGLLSAPDVRRALAAGATAVLVGTAILCDPDPPGRLARLAAELRAA